MKKHSIKILKYLIILIAIFIMTTSVIGIISLIQEPINPTYGLILYPIVTILYLSTILIYLAFYQTIMFLKLIDQPVIKYENSIENLQKIRVYGVIFALLYVINLPFFYMLAEVDDAPGLIFIGMIPLIGGFIVYLFADIMIKLLNEKSK